MNLRNNNSNKSSSSFLIKNKKHTTATTTTTTTISSQGAKGGQQEQRQQQQQQQQQQQSQSQSQSQSQRQSQTQQRRRVLAARWKDNDNNFTTTKRDEYSIPNDNVQNTHNNHNRNNHNNNNSNHNININNTKTIINNKKIEIRKLELIGLMALVSLISIQWNNNQWVISVTSSVTSASTSTSTIQQQQQYQQYNVEEDMIFPSPNLYKNHHQRQYYNDMNDKGEDEEQEDWFDYNDWTTNPITNDSCIVIENVCHLGQEWFYYNTHNNNHNHNDDDATTTNTNTTTTTNTMQPYPFKLLLRWRQSSLFVQESTVPKGYPNEISIQQQQQMHQQLHQCTFSPIPNHMILHSHSNHMLGEFYTRTFIGLSKLITTILWNQYNHTLSSSSSVQPNLSKQQLQPKQLFSKMTQFYMHFHKGGMTPKRYNNKNNHFQNVPNNGHHRHRQLAKKNTKSTTTTNTFVTMKEEESYNDFLEQSSSSSSSSTPLSLLLQSHKLYLGMWSQNPVLPFTELLDSTHCRCMKRVFFCGYDSISPSPPTTTTTSTLLSSSTVPFTSTRTTNNHEQLSSSSTTGITLRPGQRIGGTKQHPLPPLLPPISSTSTSTLSSTKNTDDVSPTYNTTATTTDSSSSDTNNNYFYNDDYSFMRQVIRREFIQNNNPMIQNQIQQFRMKILEQVWKRRNYATSSSTTSYNNNNNNNHLYNNQFNGTDWKIVGLTQRTKRRSWKNLQSLIDFCNLKFATPSIKIVCIPVNIDDYQNNNNNNNNNYYIQSDDNDENIMTKLYSNPMQQLIVHGALDAIMGIHGAQLTQGILLPPNSVIIEFLPWIPSSIDWGQWTRWVHRPTPLGVIFSNTDLNHIGYPLQQDSSIDTCQEQNQDNQQNNNNNNNLVNTSCYMEYNNRWDQRDFVISPTIFQSILIDLIWKQPETCQDYVSHAGDDYVLYNVYCVPPFTQKKYHFDNPNAKESHSYYRNKNWIK